MSRLYNKRVPVPATISRASANQQNISTRLQIRLRLQTTTMGDVDRGYINLLSILRDHPSSVALNVLISGISHYLSHALPGQPSPTPLVETIAQSPIWLSLSLQQYIELGNAFGQALLSVRNELEKQQHGLFTPLLSYSLRQWLNVVLNGLKAAHPLTRLTIYRGVLLAMDSNLEVDKLLGPKMRKRINRGAVLAFAEVIDHDEDKADKVWLKEFTDGDVEGTYTYQRHI